MKGEAIFEYRDADTGELKFIEHVRNLIVTDGKESMAKVLAGVTENGAGTITYCAVGTGTNSPVVADSALQTELFRKQISVRTAEGRTAIFKTFFNRNEANGTLREAGLFGEGASAVTDSGVLFARLAINRTKSSNDTLTITWMVTVGSAA